MMRSQKMQTRGGALLLSTIIVLIVAGLISAFYSISMINNRSTTNVGFAQQALYTAEAGASLCIEDLNRGGPGVLSGKFSGGTFEITLRSYGSDGLDNDGNGNTDDDYEKNYMELDVVGACYGMRRRLNILLSRAGGGVFWNALFAGNRYGDSGYSLELGGQGRQADEVRGNVYSGGSLSKRGDSVIQEYRGQEPGDFQVMSIFQAADFSSQRPALKFTRGSQPSLDLERMRYELNHNVNVQNALQSNGSVGSNPLGGSAVQIMDPDNPAHIFRMNPSDRTGLTASTTKNDYFLEDPTAPVRLDPNWDGNDASQIRLSTAGGNKKVYYVDGNLWLNNRNTYSFKFYHPEKNGVKAVFVVKGNIYFGDNLFYTNINKDAVAFIAMKDPLLPEESGNIYFGDPIFGTTRRFEGYMFAADNFYDNNLGTPSSMTTSVFGNMTAGNQVLIRRDLPNGEHVRLEVEFDPKVRLGYGPPGLPPNLGVEMSSWKIVSWKQVP